MAKGMDVGTMALLGGGGYLALAYYEGFWPFKAAPAPSLLTTPNYVPPTPKPPVTTQKPVDNTTPATPPVTPAVSCGAGYTLVNGTCTPSNYNPANPTYCDLKTPGWSIQDGACKQTPAAAPSPKAISEQMITLAGTSVGLSTDQWCYYYTQATGNECPVDPGSIDMTVYNGAGVNLEDGTIGDRTTPISIETWLAIMQSQAPSLGLSGLGADFMTPSIPLLIAAGVAALMFMGKH